MNRLEKGFRNLDRHKIVGANVAKYRKLARKHQWEVADFLDIPRPSVSKIESGERRLDAVELGDLAVFLNTSVESFLVGTQKSDLNTATENVAQTKFVIFDYNHLPFSC